MKTKDDSLSKEPQVLQQPLEKKIDNSSDMSHPSDGSNLLTQKQGLSMPEKRKTNYWMISTLVLFLVSILGGAFYYWRVNKSTILQNNNLLTTSNTSSTLVDDEGDLSTSYRLSGKLAFISDDNLWFMNNGSLKQITLDAISAKIPYWSGLPKLWYSNPQISPDGNKMAFLKNTDSRTLMVIDIDGKNVKEIANDVEWTMPIIQWSKDSKQVYYPSSAGMDLIVVKSVDVITKNKSEYGQFVMGSGCGGGSSDPADHVSANENIISVGGGVQVFSISPQNDYIVHTILCTGNGLGILDLSTKQDKKIDDKATKAVISPDGKNIAAISEKNIIIFDTMGKILKTVQTPEIPLVLSWDTDGKTIYYSSSTLLKSLDFDDELALDVLGSSPASYRVNKSTLWSLSLNDGKNEKIMDFDAHNIKPIFVSNQRMFVVIVENSTALFDYINQQKTRDGSLDYYPKAVLKELNLLDLTSPITVDKVQQPSFLP